MKYSFTITNTEKYKQIFKLSVSFYNDSDVVGELLFDVNCWCLASCMAVLCRMVRLDWMVWMVREGGWREGGRMRKGQREGREVERGGEREIESDNYILWNSIVLVFC